MIPNLKTRAFILRILCAMLLVFVGFAHAPIAVSSVQTPDAASYALPDGSFASLCQPGAHEKQNKHIDRGCEACRLGSSIVVPCAPSEGEPIVRVATRVALIFATEYVHRLNFPPNAPPRGPPLAVSLSAA